MIHTFKNLNLCNITLICLHIYLNHFSSHDFNHLQTFLIHVGLAVKIF